MPWNFPANPSLNDTYSFGGKTWIWNGEYWDQDPTVITAGAINNIPIGNVTASTGQFTDVTAANVFTDNYRYANGDPFVSSNYGDSNVVTYLGNVAANIVPAANVTYDLGSSTNRWNQLFLAGNTIDLGGALIKADSDSGTIALIPTVANGESSTKAIVIGSTGIATVNTDGSGQVSAQDIANAAASANTQTGNLTVTGQASVAGNITGGNVLASAFYFANGDPFVSGGAANLVIGTRTSPIYVALATATTLDVVGRSSNVTVTLTT